MPKFGDINGQADDLLWGAPPDTPFQGPGLTFKVKAPKVDAFGMFAFTPSLKSVQKDFAEKGVMCDAAATPSFKFDQVALGPVGFTLDKFELKGAKGVNFESKYSFAEVDKNLSAGFNGCYVGGELKEKVLKLGHKDLGGANVNAKIEFDADKYGLDAGLSVTDEINAGIKLAGALKDPTPSKVSLGANYVCADVSVGLDTTIKIPKGEEKIVPSGDLTFSSSTLVPDSKVGGKISYSGAKVDAVEFGLKHTGIENTQINAAVQLQPQEKTAYGKSTLALKYNVRKGASVTVQVDHDGTAAKPLVLFELA
jgi:hypothetical protein